MKSLNFIQLDIPNEKNSHVTFQSRLMPQTDYENITPEEKQIILARHDEIRKLVHEAVYDYLHDESLCYDDKDIFPNWIDLTGNYYIGSESYCIEEDKTLRISIFTRFTEILNGTERDYLGLEVWMEAPSLTEPLAVYAVDSSCI